MKQRTARWLNLIFLALGAGGLAWLIHQLGVDAIGDGLRRVGPWFALVIAAHMTAICIDGVTLRAAAGDAGREGPYRLFARASLAGHGINQATPLGKLGELTKITVLGEVMPTARATAALIVQNFVMFAVNCATIIAGVIAIATVFTPTPRVMTALWLIAGAFALLGMAALVLMSRGVGQLPLRVAALFGVRGQRAARWRDGWQRIADAWRETASRRRYMVTAFASCLGSRIADVAELAVVLALLDVDPVAPAALAALAGQQVVFWLTSFVPLQAGTAEGGAYLLFKSIGLPPAAGVLLELVIKARRLIFIAIAILLVGWRATWRPS